MLKQAVHSDHSRKGEAKDYAQELQEVLKNEGQKNTNIYMYKKENEKLAVTFNSLLIYCNTLLFYYIIIIMIKEERRSLCTRDMKKT